MNLVAIADDLKNLADNQLVQELNSPRGIAPSYLVLSEIKRRKDMRSSYPTEAPTGTMAEQYSQGLMSMGAPNMQAAMNQSNVTGQPVPYGAGQVQGAQAPAQEPAVQAFADGGKVEMAPPAEMAARAHKDDGPVYWTDFLTGNKKDALGLGVFAGPLMAPLTNIINGASFGDIMKSMSPAATALNALGVKFADGGPINGDFAGKMGLSSGFMARQAQPPVAQLASKALAMGADQVDPMAPVGIGGIAEAAPVMQEQSDPMMGLLMGGDGSSDGAADAGSADASGSADGSAFADGGEVGGYSPMMSYAERIRQLARMPIGRDFSGPMSVPEPVRRSMFENIRDRYQAAMSRPSEDLATLTFGKSNYFNPPAPEDTPPPGAGYDYGPMPESWVPNPDAPPKRHPFARPREEITPMTRPEPSVPNAEAPPAVTSRDFDPANAGLGRYYATPNMGVTDGIPPGEFTDGRDASGPDGGIAPAALGSRGGPRGGGAGAGSAGGGAGLVSTPGGSLSEFMDQVRALQMPDRFAELAAANAAEKERLMAGSNEDKGLALLTAGLGIMGGESPFALVNIGRGAQMGVRQYNEATKEQRQALQGLRAADQQIAIAQATRDERQLEVGLKMKMAAEEAMMRSLDRQAAAADRAAARADAAEDRRINQELRVNELKESRSIREQQSVISEMNEHRSTIKGIDTIMVNPMLSDEQRKVYKLQRDAAEENLNAAIGRLRALRGEYDQRQPGRIATPTTQEEYNKLPSGTQYRDPSGNIRTKQ